MLTKRSKRLCAVLALTAFVAGLFCFLQQPSVHPEFGRVSASAMAEYPSVWQRTQYSFRKLFHLPTAERIWLLRIGASPLQWSTGGGARKGFIYTNDPLVNNTPLWEFALSTRARLTEVHRSDLPSEYFGMNDPRGSNVFGADWSGHAIRVAEGQVFFARLVTNRAVVYVIRLAEQGVEQQRGRMRVECVTVKQ